MTGRLPNIEAVVKTTATGSGRIGSVVDALCCAVEVQHEMSENAAIARSDAN